MTDTPDSVKKEELVITRIIDAPLEMVWKAWTIPEHVMRWWGPKDYTSPTCKIDLREGGKYIFCMSARRNIRAARIHTLLGFTRRSCPCSGWNSPRDCPTRMATRLTLLRWACRLTFQKR